MNLSPIGAAALIAREGRRLKAYRDSVGVWTIGIGCTTIDGVPVRSGMTISAAECDALFERTVARYVDAVNRGLGETRVPQHAFDALVSICFNIGIGTANPKKGQKPGFLGSSFLKRINARASTADIQAAILMWGKPAEIIPRRQAEADQYGTPYATALPKARRSDAKRIAVAAPVAEVLTPEVPTPVIVPVAPPPLAAPPSWQPEWLVWLLAVLDGRYAKAAHDRDEVQDAKAA